MLASLTISNVILIEKLSIEFEAGLCALTGETGAGKSILLDSLGLALGNRSESGIVRKGADQAAVTAEFILKDKHPVFSFLKEQGIEGQSPLILRRMVNNDGRSRAFINDQPVSVSLLKQTGEFLVEIHGQFETQSLLNPRIHRDLLDEYAVTAKDRDDLRGAWEAWQEKAEIYQMEKTRLEKARGDEAYLRSALEALDELAPEAGEEDKLTSLRSRLMRREQNLGHLNAAFSGIEEVQGILNSVWRALEKTGDEAAAALGSLDRAGAELQETLAGVEDLSAALEESEYSLSEIDDRLFALKGQARKHGCTIDTLPEKRNELAGLLNGLAHQEDTLSALEQDVRKRREIYIEKAKAVSAVRKKAAARLDGLVAKELVPLKLEKARFETVVEDAGEEAWGPAGFDRVQFLVATNPGAAAGPLNKIASGGEMARFMLSLKVVLAEVGVAGTLVFDEVDSGIGGATADAVGERLAKLAAKRQILVVTHSPQVAARAGHHWIVAKGGKETVTTNVIALQKDSQRQEEIARMLSGAEITAEARAAAGKLLEHKAA